MEALDGNLLIAQSGGPTAVINASLTGVISEALNYDCIEEIYGSCNGIVGVLKEDLVDLAEELQQTMQKLRLTPGAALGTCRFKLGKGQDYERILQVFEPHDIRHFFYIGGNDSQDTANKIAAFAQEKGYPIRVIGIPKTIDNDLLHTDHCPGYGSVIKYIATTIREIAADNASMGHHDLVSIIEVMGRDTGWIAAGASLAKRRLHPEEAPHLICLPETPFVAASFLKAIQQVLKRQRFCLVVTAEGLLDPDGNYVATESSSTDQFGHMQLGGVGDYLKRLVETNLGIKTHSTKLGLAQRAAAHCSSVTDNGAAFLCGQAAVKAAVSGETRKMVALSRNEAGSYESETKLVPLEEVANGIRKVPKEWLHEDGFSVNHLFYKYALPLIQGEAHPPHEGGLPLFAQLKKARVEKKLPPYEGI